MLIHQASI